MTKLYTIKVIPGAKKNVVKQQPDMWEEEVLKVYVTAPAVEGKANKAVIEILADHFHVKKAQISIINGLKSRHKTISIGEL